MKKIKWLIIGLTTAFVVGLVTAKLLWPMMFNLDELTNTSDTTSLDKK